MGLQCLIRVVTGKLEPDRGEPPIQETCPPVHHDLFITLLNRVIDFLNTAFHVQRVLQGSSGKPCRIVRGLLCLSLCSVHSELRHGPIPRCGSHQRLHGPEHDAPRALSSCARSLSRDGMCGKRSLSPLPQAALKRRSRLSAFCSRS